MFQMRRSILIWMATTVLQGIVSHAFVLPNSSPSFTTSTSTFTSKYTSTFYSTTQTKTQLQAEKKSSKPTGVYSRPSAAIERGSGFYVPGLEGSRVRGLFGLLILALTFVNHSYYGNSISSSEAMEFSETISIAYGVLLILQGLVEFGKEYGFGVDLDTTTTADVKMMTKDSNVVTKEGSASTSTSTSTSTSSKSVTQYASPTFLEMCSDKTLLNDLQWVAASFVSLTPATHVLLVKSDANTENNSNTPTLLYTLGDFSNQSTMNDDTDPNTQKAIQNVIDTVFESRGGRVSIPSDHPGSILLPESHRRCILLQKLTLADTESQYAMVVGSNQLLPAFTKNDLKWLGQLAKFMEQSLDQYL